MSTPEMTYENQQQLRSSNYLAGAVALRAVDALQVRHRADPLPGAERLVPLDEREGDVPALRHVLQERDCAQVITAGSAAGRNRFKEPAAGSTQLKAAAAAGTAARAPNVVTRSPKASALLICGARKSVCAL